MPTSAMALKVSSGNSSIFKGNESAPKLAAKYLQAVSQADQVRRSTAISSSGSFMTDISDATSLSSGRYVHASESGSSGAEDSADDLLSTPRVAPTSNDVFNTRHVEFGHCADERFRHTSQHTPGTPFHPHIEEDPPYYILISTYLSYVILICIGHVRDFFGKRLFPAHYHHLTPHNGYAALNSDFDSFYTRRLKLRLEDCFSRPVTNVPGRTITLLDRVSDDYNESFYFTGSQTRALNVSSYNYLGFAQARGGCADAVEESIKRYGISPCASRLEGGTTDLHVQAEALVARFVGKEDALIGSMGFATNSATLPALVGKGSLVISDEFNHASIRVGVRLSGASVKTFKHNDMADLEKVLREMISQGQPRTHRPWKKILLVVEGLYSMEGTLLDLPTIMQLKKRYKFYLYVDEAHSIGAIGPQGRGVANYFHVPPKDIDILMGTFTKSFGASGGYIAGSKELISRLRTLSQSSSYSESMTPAVLTQIIASVASIMGIEASESHTPVRARTITGVPTAETPGFEHLAPAPASAVPVWFSLPKELRDGSEGQQRLRRLAFNGRYLSLGLAKLGFIVFGHADSPIIPLLLFNPGKMPLFSRLMAERKTAIVVVVVGYPATTLVMSRVRFCLSAAHTKYDVDELLRACDSIGDVLDLKLRSAERWSIDQVTERAVELVKGTA